jgi:hypothetical protein
MSSDFEGPIFGLLLFDTFAVSSMAEKVGRPGLAAARAQVATAAIPCLPRHGAEIDVVLARPPVIGGDGFTLHLSDRRPVLSQPIKAETRIALM